MIMRNLILLAYCWLPLLIAPLAAQALTIKQSNVAFNAGGFDSFQVLGDFEGLTLDQADQVRLDVGGFTQSIPLSAFKKQKDLYKYTAPKGEIGLTSVMINLQRKTFYAKGQNLRLGGFTNPLAVRLAAGVFDDCAMLTFSGKAAAWTFSSKNNSQSACLLVDAPKTEPGAFLAGEPQDVRIQARVAPDVPFDKKSVDLVEVDPLTKTPRVELLCNLVDDGNTSAGDDVAGDNVFSCLAPFNEASPRGILLTVRARMGSDVVYSPYFPLEAVASLGAEAAAEAANTQQAALQIWQEKSAGLGYGNKARKQTLKQILALPGVAKAGISKDGFTIWIKYSSGISGGLMTNPPGTRGGVGKLADAQALNTSPASFSRYTKTIPGVMPSISASNPVQKTADRAVGNNKVLIWDAYRSDFAPFDEASNLQQLYQGAQCPKFDVTYLKDEQATLASVKSFSEYGTIILVTHGALDSDGQAIFLTQEKVDADSILQYAPELVSGQLVMMGDAFAVRPSFIKNLPGNFEGSIVYNGSCQSSANNTMANAFLNKGANTYYGFNRAVNSDFAKNVAEQLFPSLVTSGRNAGDAFSPVFPKIDLSAPFAGFYQSGDNKTAYSGQFRNGDFETGDLTAWKRVGDGRVVSALGEYSSSGKFMGLVSTGLGLTGASGSIEQNFCLPANATHLQFNWNLSSEKFREFCKGQVDSFDVELIDAAGTHRLLHQSVNDMCASSALSRSGLHFDRGPNGDVWSTGWVSEKIAISSFAAAGKGKGVKVVFRTSGTSTYDTATLVDDIELVVP